MNKKDLIDLGAALTLLGILTYFAFTINISLLQIVTPIAWAAFMADCFRFMLHRLARGYTKKEKNRLTFGS